MSISVKTVRSFESKLVPDIRKDFGLNEEPFRDIDDDLVLLAFMPNCDQKIIAQVSVKRLQSKYGKCDHQSLEFYGDRILYGVIASYVYDIFGLNNTAEFLTHLISHLTSNRILTDLMLNKDSCKYIRSPNYIIRMDTPRFHNQCADAMESLIGALFVYLTFKKLDIIQNLKIWLLKNTNLSSFLTSYLVEVGTHIEGVYTISNKLSSLRKIQDKQKKLLSDLEVLRPELGEELYQSLLETFTEDVPELEDFAVQSKIVQSNVDLKDIYRQLKWQYQIDYDPTLESYLVYGFPNMKKKIIGSGLNKEEAIQDAKEYLTLMGYIVNIKTPIKQFVY